MSDTYVADPVVTFYNTSLNYITYAVTATTPDGCQGADSITVRIFKTMPDIFVPSGFTPNQDGVNDIFRPVLAGIAKIDFFRVFNRWGQLIYATSTPGQGWDGTFHGTMQDIGTFVYVIQAVDYTGKVILKKGSVTLIR
jgi:gliding motility-associated-like protein